MKRKFFAAAAIALAAGLAIAAAGVARAADNRFFSMVPSAGAKACLDKTAFGRVTVNALGPVETMHVEIWHMPPNTEFDVFLIQVPTAPFGLSWYQGDIVTSDAGIGVADFVGRFSKETFIVAQGTAAAPAVFTSPPFPDATSNPATKPG
ncbi:MAG TPA: hypothetical protein VGF07_10835, partial [Stellaceae bacterium]